MPVQISMTDPDEPEIWTQWRQGDIGELDQLARTELSADGRTIVSAFAGRFVVLTQTCDLVRSPDSRPHVVVAPLVRIDSAENLDLIKKRRIPQYVYVDNAPEGFAADLDAAMTLTKDLLTTIERLPGLEGNTQVREFARAISRKYGRAAIPNDIDALLKPIRERIKSRHGSSLSPEGVLFNDQLVDVRIEIEPDNWDADALDITVVFVLPAYAVRLVTNPLPCDEVDTWWNDTTRSATDIAVKLAGDWDNDTTLWLWERIAKAWIEGCNTEGHRAESLTAEVATADTYGLNRIERSDQLDLHYLSSLD